MKAPCLNFSLRGWFVGMILGLAIVLAGSIASIGAADGVERFRSGFPLDEAQPATTQIMRVRLTSQPSAGQVVVINLASDTALGVTLSQGTLTFTNADWNEFQFTTITTVDDAVIEPSNHATAVTLTVDPTATTFDVYDNIAIPKLDIAIKDNDGTITLYHTGSLFDEGDLSGMRTLYLRLNSQPTSGQVVVINLASDTAQGIALSKSTLTFNNTDWNVFQTITMTTVDDTVVEAFNHSTTVMLTVNQAATTFNSFDSVIIPALFFTIKDNDAPITLYHTGALLDESTLAGTRTLFLRLNTQPPAGQVVVIDLGSDTTQGVSLSQNSLTFTNVDWNVFQATTITAIDDAEVEAMSHLTTISLAIDQTETTFDAYDSVVISSLSIAIKDNDDPITFYRTGLPLDEADPANTQILRMRLNTQPTVGQVVVIDLGADTIQGVTLSQNTLTFTNSNWNVYQDVTITPVDDAVLEPINHLTTVTLTVNVAATTFDAYDSVTVPSQIVPIKDNDGPVTLYRTGASLDEADLAATQILRVRLNSQPTTGQVVVIDLGSDFAQGVNLSQSTLIFTNANWNLYQDVTITTADDAVLESSSHVTTVTLTVDPAATTFSDYDNVTIPSQIIAITDNDGPVTYYRTGLPLDEADLATTQTLRVRLNTQPTSGQVVAIDLGSDTVQGVTLSQNTLTFTNANWNLYQDTTITAVDDAVLENITHSTIVALTVDPTATTYDAFDSVTIPSQSIAIKDNDGPVTVYRTGLVLDEANLAETQTLRVRLNTQPTAGQVVVIDLTSNTVQGVSLSQNTLIFTNANWNLYQDTTITTVDDTVVESSTHAAIVTLTINQTATTYDAYDSVTISNQSIPIKDNDHSLNLSETAFNFSTTQIAGNPASQTFNVTRSGNGTAAWTIVSSAAWLTVDLASGTTTAETDIISVSVDKSSLAAGVHNATLTVSDPVASNNPQTVNVSFTIATSPTQFVLSTTAVAFDTGIDHPLPSIQLANGGDGTMNWTAVSNQTWLVPSLAAGATVYNSPAKIDCKLYFSLLPPGTYNATLTLTSAEANNSPQVVTVAMTVKACNDFETSGAYLRTLNVTPWGNDGTADGSGGWPFRTLRAAVEAAIPGDIIQLSAGNFEGWTAGNIKQIVGTYANPIKIQGDPAGGTNIVCAGDNLLHGLNLTSCAFLTMQDLNITGFSDRGISVNGDTWVSGRSHHIVIRRCHFSNSTNAAPNSIRLQNTDCSLIEDCTITTPVANSANDPIRLVSSHHNIVRGCYVHDCLRNAMRLASQCEDNLFFSNKLENIVNVGIYLNGFRNSAVANLCINTFVALRFEAAEEPLAANNTIYRPRQYCLWFSTPVGDPFITRNGRVINNIFVFKNSELTNYCNNGANTFPATFAYKNNAWYSLDNAGFAGPTNTAATEISPLYQVNPQFIDIASANYRLKTGSGLRGNGLALTEVPQDADGNAYAAPPARGAYELAQQAAIGLSTTSLTMTMPSGFGASALEQVDITNTGTTQIPLNWSAGSSDLWLKATPASGTTTTETDSILVTALGAGPEAWRTLPTATGVLSPRETASVVWTGTEMIVFGGWDGGGVIAGGARYNPASNTWTPISTVGAPVARNSHAAVWTGTEMIVWGGWDGSTWLNNGGCYNPATDTWTGTTSTTDAPVARRFHSAIWTGGEMIIWGGAGNTPALQDGGRYDPDTDSWSTTAISTTDAPAGRLEHSAIWTGTEMIVWGGCSTYAELAGMNDGGRYNPATNTWSATAMSTASAPSARFGHTAVWTGAQMIVWGGGINPTTRVSTGGWYDPATNTWTATTLESTAPLNRQHHHAVWAGSQMVVWGGYTNTGNHLWFNDTNLYNPAFALTPGLHNGTVIVSDPAASNNPRTINVAVTVTGGTHLAYGIPPSTDEQAGASTFSYFTVEVRDNAGAVVASDNTTQITVASGAGAGTLSGTLTRTVVNGIAVFDDLKFSAGVTLPLVLSSVPSYTPPSPDFEIAMHLSPPTGLPIERVSVDSAGNQQTNSGFAPTSPDISADGRFTTFLSRSTNLVTTTTLTNLQQFHHDRETGLTQATSLTAAGLQDGSTDQSSYRSALSANGRFASFIHSGGNLAPPDTNAKKDVLIRDLWTLTTTRASLGSAGESSTDHCTQFSLSASGRFMVFQTAGSGLIASDTNGVADLYLRDLALNVTSRISVSTAGVEGNGASSLGWISANGRYVLFSSAASNLVVNDTNASGDAFLRDLQTNTTTRVSTDGAGAQATGPSTGIGLSADGVWALFDSSAANLVVGDTNGKFDVFRKNTSTGAIQRVSVSTSGAQADQNCFGYGISADGRFVLFESIAGTLDGVNPTAITYLYVRDCDTGVTRKVNRGYNGVAPDGHSSNAAISADGRYIIYNTVATNHIPDDTNATDDAYVVPNPLYNATPNLQALPAGLVFTVDRDGPQAAHQAVYIQNVGSGAMSWTVTSNQPWLQVGPTLGSVTTGVDVLDVTADSTDLAAGFYYGALTITAPGAFNGTKIVEVRLNVLPVADIGLNPTTLTFNATAGGATPPAQVVTVSNTGDVGSTLNWSATGSQTWLTLTPETGTIFWGSTPLTVTAKATGGDAWNLQTSTVGGPSVREAHSAVWTGTEMIVWGGWADSVQPNGGIYNPVTNSWRSIATLNAPQVAKHAAVWTGTKMLVWGGMNSSSNFLNTCSSYDPATDTWQSLSSTNAPSGRWHPTAVWTGTEMIVWGGQTSGGLANDGGRFDPATDTWSTTPMSTTNAPSARTGHAAVWTGVEMIVWGGTVNGQVSGLDTGARYSPATNTWSATPTSITGAPLARSHHSAIWTGSYMVVWGGASDLGTRLNTGAFYDPATDTWTGSTSTTGVPDIRQAHSAIWTGNRMLVWGGWFGSGGLGHIRYNDGKFYAPTYQLDPGTYNATITVSDPDASNSPQTVSVTLNVHTPLRVTAMDPAPASASTTSPAAITLDFTEPVDAATVNLQTIQLTGSGGDGTFGDGNELSILPDGVSLNTTTQAQIDLSSVTLTPDTYRVTAIADSSAGNAVTLDGIDDGVRIPSSLNLNPTTALTVEAWFNFSSGGTGNPRIVSKGDLYYEVYTVGTGASRKIGAIFGLSSLQSTNNFSAGTWHHVAVTYDASAFTLYVDGVQEATSASGGALTSTSDPLVFGFKSAAASNYFKGSIDEIRLWNSARTLTQIQDNMHANLTGSESGLLGYWRLNELSGQTVEDASVYDKDGTLGADNTVAGDDPTRTASGATLDGLRNLNGIALDGEFTGGFPTGNDSPGGNFQATFEIQP